jgi:CHAD domain-containing protein
MVKLERSIDGLDPHAPVDKNARILVQARLEEMYQWEMYVDDPFRIHELHALRIAAKRLRYTLELFAGTLPEAHVPLLQAVEQVQEKLGMLHDSDVMIALLRLCLGSLDSGSGYEYALAKIAKRGARGKFILNPEMFVFLLEPAATPSTEERYGLECLLGVLQSRREEQYMQFYQYWQHLQVSGFRREFERIL